MDEEEVITEEDITSTPQERNVWNGQAVHLLINEYKKFRILFGNPEIRRKKIWDKISNRIQALGYDFDSEQCEKKWRYLRNYYAINETKNIVTWPFYEAMRDALHGGHSLIPKAQEDSGYDYNSAIDGQVEMSQRTSFDQDENEVDDSAPPAWFADFLTQFREDEKAKLKMLEEMHEDIIKLEQKKCSLLQTLIEKLT